MKKGLVTIAVMLTVLAVPLILIFLHRSKKDAQPAFQAAVRTERRAGQGAVYLVEQDGFYVVTAAHVLSGLAPGDVCAVLCADGEERSASVVYISGAADVGFLHVAGDAQGIAGVSADRTAFDALAAGDGLWAVSFDGMKADRFYGTLLEPWIYVEDFSLDMMLARLPAAPGMSGCAILDGEGNFSGILCGVNEEGEAAILPLSVIESEWIMARQDTD